MRTHLLWCLLTSFAFATFNCAVPEITWGKYGRPIAVSQMEVSQICPDNNIWKFLAHGNVCLGPIGEFIGYYEHQRTCGFQHPLGGLIGPLQELGVIHDVCDFAKSRFPSNADYFYVGASRKKNVSDAVFMWNTTAEAVDMKLNWAKGEPDGTDANPQNCLVVSMSDKGKDCEFYDIDCEEKLPAICGIQDAYPCAGLTNGGCEQLCLVNDARSRICACHPGYNEAVNTSCVEINECKVDKGGCEQICNNKPGSYVCTCEDGYRKIGSFGCEVDDPCKVDNGGCHHYCDFKDGVVVCTCMDGFIMSKNTSKCTIDINWESEEAAAGKSSRYVMFIVLPIVSAVFAITVMIFIIIVGISQNIQDKHRKKQPKELPFHGASLEVKVSRKLAKKNVGKYHPKYGTGV